MSKPPAPSQAALVLQALMREDAEKYAIRLARQNRDPAPGIKGVPRLQFRNE